MASLPMRYDSSKAVNELGLPQTPLEAAVEEAVHWFRQHGYVTQGGA
jgi:dihydroflavonol-4-reductase